MTQDMVVAGDLVCCIDDRRVGVVTAVVGEYIRMNNLDGVGIMVPLSDVYTVDHHRVTMIGSYASFRAQVAPKFEAPLTQAPVREAQEA